MPCRNCSRSKRSQSTPIASPTRRASSVVVLRVSVMTWVHLGVDDGTDLPVCLPCTGRHGGWRNVGPGEPNQGGDMPTPIDRDELQRLRREERAQLVEVLPADEFEDEHLPGAINIPLKTLDRESTASLDPQRPVIVYCYDYQ